VSPDGSLGRPDGQLFPCPKSNSRIFVGPSRCKMFPSGRGLSGCFYWPSRYIIYIIFSKLSNDADFVPIRYLSKKL